MANNLVDSMMQEMEQYNSPQDMNYQPELPQGGPQNGEMQYNPNMGGGGGGYMGGGGPQMPGPHPQMMQPMPQRGPPMMQPEDTIVRMQPQIVSESPEMPDIEAPDMNKYGMEDEDVGGWVEKLLSEIKAPLVVVILAFLMSVPQINSIVRTGLGKITSNMLYIGIMQSFVIGILFYVITKFL